ncbi:Uncharacterised protein [Sphingobacterium multivorum]|uniref:Uncharacterized protein n=1 Tax=Sphingobacterium multivorum TaxID=28454 RepID=A0A2X2ISK8_SPHMU|nr:Uncharacterised protein [Sphingobacterium multivorum]
MLLKMQCVFEKLNEINMIQSKIIQTICIKRKSHPLKNGSIIFYKQKILCQLLHLFDSQS